MTNIPGVREEVEMTVLNHVFRFRRLKWQDMASVNTWILEHTMAERLAVTSHALFNVSGRDITPAEAVKILVALPRAAQETVFKFYRGSLDPHRMFDTVPLYAAPDAVTYSRRILEEEAETDKQVDELEEFLTAKFGRREVEEELEMGRRIVEGTGYAGAMSRESEFIEKTRPRSDEE